MSIATIALSNKSSPARRGVVREETYSLAVQRAFHELGTNAVEKQREELKLLQQAIDDERLAREATLRRRAAEVENARVVAKQMELRRERDLSSRVEDQTPAIQPQLSGYPHLPETPERERRLQKWTRQQELKRCLDEQYHSQLTSRKAVEENEMQAERERLEQTKRDLEALEMQRVMKRTRDREALTRAWGDAERAKAVRSRIERMQLHGLNPRLEPISAFLRRSIGVEEDDGDLNESRFVAEKPVEVQQREVKKRDESPEQKVETEDPLTMPPPPAVSNSVVLPAVPVESLEKGARSRSFDTKPEAVVLPIIQQYHAADANHRTRLKGRLADSVGRHAAVVQIRSRKTSQEPITAKPMPPDSPRNANWTFATTNPTTDRAISHQSTDGRSQSQVMKPSVHVVRRYEQQRYHSRVLTETGANTLQRPPGK